MLKVIDRFTTLDGSWEPNNKPFSITPTAAAKYSSIPGKGAAHHIFVRVPQDAGVVEFNTEDGKNPSGPLVPDSSRWVNFPMFGSSAFNPVRDNGGPWHVWIDGERVTKSGEGMGLPYGWHVSTFLVVEDAEPDVQVPPEGSAARFTLYRNGALVYDSEA
jgi:hypothetical protein